MRNSTERINGEARQEAELPNVRLLTKEQFKGELAMRGEQRIGSARVGVLWNKLTRFCACC